MVNFIFIALHLLALVFFVAELIVCLSNISFRIQVSKNEPGTLSKKISLVEETTLIKRQLLFSFGAVVSSILTILDFKFVLLIPKYALVIVYLLTMFLLHLSYPSVDAIFKTMSEFRSKSKYYTDFLPEDKDLYRKLKQDRNAYIVEFLFLLFSVIYVMLFLG